MLEYMREVNVAIMMLLFQHYYGYRNQIHNLTNVRGQRFWMQRGASSKKYSYLLSSALGRLSIVTTVVVILSASLS